ncbi:YcnI family copper-binding membrane protein [Nocardioides sp. Iso805N]|uniref:YcnI family copper-binding membrane protein n=1 Tax=Nocardioides sp. Iso805N TaxID=1283287 RepID=UPI00035E754C|nr:YcnI family protein [Nocardioides sp. Iso805N]
MMNRTFAVPAVAAAALTATFALAGAASAHVTVNPNMATGGSYSKLTFRVPTESDTASTKKVVVYFPEDHPFASASVKPHPGWSFTVKDHKLSTPITSDDGQVTEAVQKIVWTATSAASQIKPGEFDEFDVSVGPLPNSGTVVFKALQYYTDGSVVRWIEPSVAGQDEPEHPAPVLSITAATAAPSADATSGSGATADATPMSATTDDDGDSKAPLVLSILAVVLAAGSLALSVVRRKRS